MHPKIVVPPSEQPNYEARILFFAHLDAEWPALKESLFEKVWPPYRACWRQSHLDLQWAPRGHIRQVFAGDDCGFLAPLAVRDWPRLIRSRHCADLRHALFEWGSKGGIGIVDDWFLASALVTLGQFSPGRERPEHRARSVDPLLAKAIGASSYTPSFSWRYHREFHGRHWGFSFKPKFVGTFTDPDDPAIWLPGRQHEWYYGRWEQFEGRMRNRFERELSRYRKSIVTHWGLNKGSYVNYTRWTIARLSGLTWGEVVARYPELQKYSEGETQAKKRVREFAGELGLTLTSPAGHAAIRRPARRHR
jgi:hypothetical protein